MKKRNKFFFIDLAIYGLIIVAILFACGCDQQQPPDQSFDFNELAPMLDSLEKTIEAGPPSNGGLILATTIVDPATFTILSPVDSGVLGVISRRNGLWRYALGEDIRDYMTVLIDRSPINITASDTTGWTWKNGWVVRNGWNDSDTLFVIGGNGEAIPINTVGNWGGGSGSGADYLNSLSDVSMTSQTGYEILGITPGDTIFNNIPAPFWYNSTSLMNRSRDDVSFTGSHHIDSVDYIKWHDPDGSGKRWKFEERSDGRFTLEYGEGTTDISVAFYIDGTIRIGDDVNDPYLFPASHTGATDGDYLTINTTTDELEWTTPTSGGDNSFDTTYIQFHVEDRLTSLPGTSSTIGDGFFRTPSHLGGWDIARVAYCVATPGAGGTYPFQLQKNGSVNVFGATLPAGSGFIETTGNYTMSSGDIYTVTIPTTSTATTEPRGLTVQLMLVR